MKEIRKNHKALSYEPARILHLLEHYLPNINHLSCLVVGRCSDDILKLLKRLGYKVYFSVTAKSKYDVVINLFDYNPTVLEKMTDQVNRDGYLFHFVHNYFGFNRLAPIGVSRKKSKLLTSYNHIKQYDRLLRSYGYSPLLRDVVGHFKLHKWDYKESQAPTLLNKIGLHIPNARLYSPYIAYIYQETEAPIRFYLSEYSLIKRVPRFSKRVYNFFKSGGGLKTLTSILEKPYLKLKLNRYSKLGSEKKKLLICTTWLQVGGVERVLLNLIEDLYKEFEIHIITSLPNKNEWEPEFKKFSSRILHLPHIAAKRHQPWFIAEYVKALKIDVVLMTNSIPAYQSIPLIRRFSSTVKIFDLLHTHGRPEEHDAFLPIAMPYNDLINKRVVISEYLKKYYCSNYHVSKHHVAVIYNSIGKDVINKIIAAKKWNNILRRNEEEFIISYLGRLTIDKNPLRLIEIAKIVVKDNKHTNIIFAIGGDGPLKTNMDKMIKDWGLSNNVKMLGHVSDSLNLMAASDLTILTSDMEGIPMSVLESMSVGVPVIAPAVGGIPEIVDDGVDGYLIRFSNIDITKRFAERIIKIANNPTHRKEIVANTRKKVVNKFTGMSREYKELFLG